jgi:hypothetical protein
MDRYKLETALFDRFELSMTQEQAEACCLPRVDAITAVRRLLRSNEGLNTQLDRIGAGTIRDELAGYGAWDDDELMNDAENRARIVWIAAGNIWDEVQEREKGVKHA